jgi:hypothetical protein
VYTNGWLGSVDKISLGKMGKSKKPSGNEKNKVMGKTKASNCTVEIDDMFSKLKEKKKMKESTGIVEQIEEEEEPPASFVQRIPLGKKKSTKKSVSAKPKRYDTDGMPIFTEESLGINQPGSGDTGLCPFDCWCCF